LACRKKIRSKRGGRLEICVIITATTNHNGGLPCERIWGLANIFADISAVAFSPDGRWIASAGEDSTVRVWNGRTSKLVRTFRGHTARVSSLAFAFTPNGRWLISGSRDQSPCGTAESRAARAPRAYRQLSACEGQGRESPRGRVPACEPAS